VQLEDLLVEKDAAGCWNLGIALSLGSSCLGSSCVIITVRSMFVIVSFKRTLMMFKMVLLGFQFGGRGFRAPTAAGYKKVVNLGSM
jgi:hypothetical protein